MCLSLILNRVYSLLTAKKASEPSFCSGFKIHVSIVSRLPFAFKIIQPIIFFCSQESKFFTIKEFFHSQWTFPQSRNFFTCKKPFHSQGAFPNQRIFSHSRNFSLAKELFHSRGNFPQSRNFSTYILLDQGNFPQKNLLDQRNVPTRMFSTKLFFLDQGSFPQTKISRVKKIFVIKDQKGSLKAKILDPFNIKSYAKIFLTL